MRFSQRAISSRLLCRKVVHEVRRISYVLNHEARINVHEHRGEFDLEHVPGESEPLLWVPDQVLGAYGEVVTKGVNRRWERSWRTIEESLTVCEVPAR